MTTVSNIVRQTAYSSTHKVKVNGGKDVIEQDVPPVLDKEIQERAVTMLAENKRYPDRKNDRKYLLRGLVRCASCGDACTGHPANRRGKKYHYYRCRAGSPNNAGPGRCHKPPYVKAGWLEDLVWTDVRRFLEDPGDVLERVREQLGSADQTLDLEVRREELAKRLSARQAEKDRYVRTYAQGHISEEELSMYLSDLKNQTDNLRLLLESVEADLSHRRQRTALTESAHAWLLSLRRRLAEVEEDTPEAFRERKHLVELLVETVSVGKQDDGRAEIRITYRFGPPPVPEVSEEALSMVHRKNGSLS